MSDKMNILITGSNGQLGSELQMFNDYSYNFFFTNRESLDITNKEDIESFVELNNINTIINCAAYTAVDKAEHDELKANMINYLAVKYLAQIAKDKAIKILHISTDYVFDGENFKPYNEDDKTNPNSVYGFSKLKGEQALQKINPHNSIIIRTSWVYSSFGNNFVKTMLKMGNLQDELGIIFDQIGTPTYAKDLAKIILDILPKIQNTKVSIYNYSNEGVCSWYDFANEIMQVANIDCKIKPIETFQYPTPSARPHYSLLNKSKIKKEFDVNIPYWKDSLKKCIKILGENSDAK